MFNIILYWFHEYNVVVRHYVIYALIPPISPVPTHPQHYTQRLQLTDYIGEWSFGN